MEENIMVIMLIILKKVMGNLNGLMGKFMKALLKMVIQMEMVF